MQSPSNPRLFSPLSADVNDTGNRYIPSCFSHARYCASFKTIRTFNLSMVLSYGSISALSLELWSLSFLFPMSTIDQLASPNPIRNKLVCIVVTCVLRKLRRGKHCPMLGPFCSVAAPAVCCKNTYQRDWLLQIRREIQTGLLTGILTLTSS